MQKEKELEGGRGIIHEVEELRDGEEKIPPKENQKVFPGRE